MDIIRLLKELIGVRQDEEMIAQDVQYSLPEAERVLVISPHPDDEVIGCGGSIALYRQKSAEVLVAMLTDGENINIGEFIEQDQQIDIAEKRREEAQKVSEILDTEITFLGFPDGGLQTQREELRRRLSGIIKDFHPDMVFAPSIIEPHPDHREASYSVLDLMTEEQRFRTAWYEVGAPIRFNALAEISSVLELKKQAAEQYYYSAYANPELLWDGIQGLNDYRSMLLVKRGSYEAFLVTETRPSDDALVAWLTYGFRRRGR
jgi:LmbE family N-acetylglucosaminyl deacetylase